MMILGVDPSVTQCGVAFYRYPGDERSILCNSFSSDGATAEEQGDEFGRKFSEILVVNRPDFICHEAAIRWIAGYAKKGKPDLAGSSGGFWTPNSDQMILPEIQGHLRQAAIDEHIPHEAVAVKTWRAAIYGQGGGNLSSDKAKQAARDYCKRLGINAKNHNEAEAACIAIWAARCSSRFKQLHYLGIAL